MFDIAAVEERSGERCCRVTVCVVCRRPEGGRRGGSGNTYQKEKEEADGGRVGDNNEYLYSVQSRKEMRSKRKRKEKMEFSGGREAGDQYSSWPR